MKISEMKYERFDVDKGIEAIRAFTERVKAAKSGDELLAIRNEYLAFSKEANFSGVLCSIRHTGNTADEFYEAENNYYDEKIPTMMQHNLEFETAFLASPYLKDVVDKINPRILKQYETDKLIASEKIVPDKQEEGATTSEYVKLMAEMTFDWDGKKIPRPELLAHMHAADRDERKKAAFVLGNRLAEDGDKIDSIYDKLVHIRDAQAKKMGFENFCPMGDLSIMHIDYGRKEIAAFRESIIKYVVPAVKALREEMGKEFGYDKFMFYDNDVYLKDGNPDPILSPEEMFKAGSRMYHDMNAETGKEFDKMVENEAFDYMPRPGKWGGGYATEIGKYKQSFIMANFNGTADDMEVLTHEFGHAFAFQKCFDNDVDPEIFVGGMETAETHSMSMEMFCDKYNKDFYGDKAIKATYKHIADSLVFLPYGTMVDYFQECVYKNPDMTPAERNALWLELEKTFRPYLSYEGIPYLEKGTRWQYQQHIFESPFYYIDYVIAGSSALQYMALAQKDYDKAFASYLKLVNAAGTLKYADLAKKGGLKNPFSPESLKDVTNATLDVLAKLKSKF